MTVRAATALLPLPVPPLPRGRPNLVLTGFMGTGKTTVGRRLAEHLCLPFVDLDEAIAARSGASVAELFERLGEQGFRALERVAVADAARLSGTVIAAGGGAPLDRAAFAPLAASGHVVVLAANADEIARRLAVDADRPLLGGPDPRARIRELLASRADAYAALGTALDTSGREATAIARELAARLAPGSLSEIRVQSADGETSVLIGDQAIGAAEAALRRTLAGTSRAAIVADAAVAGTHALDVARVLADSGIEVVGPLEIPAGEAAKSLEVLAGLWDRFHAARLDASCAVVVVGGGAALDVGGFAAATFARGLRLVNVPTTVLAMADAALGGKVAIDHAGMKNLVGTFHPARLVIADTATCRTLSAKTRSEGLAEVVKAGVLASPLLLDLIADAPLGWSVEQSVRVKAAYVSADPRDRGVRKALNLGHTFAHAIETASDHRVPHGDAVAMGLVAAARLGATLATCAPELAGRIASVLERLGLPTQAPALDGARLLAALAADKKRASGEIRFVVPAQDGAAVVSGVDPREALALLRP